MKKLEPISDLGLIAGLMSLGYSPVGRIKEGRRVIFNFEWDENMESLKNDYFNHALNVDAQTFHITLKSVKSSIYQMEE